jgi:transcription elongation GreA/GreB family factor/very-short-patch-repair endonuclease
MPEIIQFSNKLCYRDTPLIPLRQYGPDRLPPLKRVFVEEGYREGSGNRVVNRSEADAIVEKIVKLCNDVRYEKKTMGVIVLQGVAQARLIEEKLLDRLGAEEMEKRRLICGNPYSFQGDQRDIIFLSMVAAPNERIGPLMKLEDERRFNVAASRARDQMWLFHSVRSDDLSASDLRRQLLEFFENNRPEKIVGRGIEIEIDELERRAAQDNRLLVKPPQPFDSWFEVDVALELLRKGFTVIPQYEVAGKRIDLVVEGGSARLAVECDGDEFHGVDQYEQDMQRQRMLERCGWVFFRVRASQFNANKQMALEGLWRLLEERGIYPYARKSTTEKIEIQTIDQKERNLNPSELKQEVKQKNYQSEPLDTRVEVGDTVVYVDTRDPESKKQVMITTERSNPEWGTVNVNTPIARAILGAKLGDVVEAILPVGTKKFQIVEITKNQLQNRLKE